LSGQDRRQFALLTGHGKFLPVLQKIAKGLGLADNLEKLDMRSRT